MTYRFLYCTLGPFRKEVYPKRKEFASAGCKFFPFRVNLFSGAWYVEGRQNKSDSNAYLKVYQFPLIIRKNKGKAMVVKNISEMRDLEKQCILMHIRSKSDDKNVIYVSKLLLWGPPF